MDPRIAKLKTPEECESFAKNARERNAPELAEDARFRAIQLRAIAYGATNEVERECLEAVYAYEEVLADGKGKRKRAGRTWPMIHKLGILPAVERIVLKRAKSAGYTALAEMGLKEFAFEAVILRHPKHFSPEAVARSRQRLAEQSIANRSVFQQEKTPPQPGEWTHRETDTATTTRFWWVNQNQTYQTEVPGGFLWSPKMRADGARNQFYENMQKVAPGDVVFSFCDARIKAVGVATGRAESSLKPDFGNAGAEWSQEGWLVPVEFRELPRGIRPKDHMAVIAPHLPARYSPLQASGNGLQSVYLAELPPLMAEVLANLLGDEYLAAIATLRAEADPDIQDDEEQDIAAVLGRTDIGPTTKAQMVQSRRGQGLFKTNVRLNEAGCRVTGITDPQHLRASHIKPWKDCSDEERLNGCNGLLLAPHADHLFDRGLISFTDQGQLLISPFLEKRVLTSWGIPCDLSVGAFSEKQVEFLDYHRRQVFKRAK